MIHWMADESCPIPSKHAGIYGQTKAEAERIVNAANSPELKTVIARPRFIWGKDDTTLLAAFKVAAQCVDR